MSIVISPARGDGSINIGGSVALFNGEYEGGPFSNYFQLSGAGVATGAQDVNAGPGTWNWLLSGNVSDFQVYCQPTTGSVEWGSAPVNTWIGLTSTRRWSRSWISSRTVLSLSIRDIATATVRATCTITLTS